MDSRSGSPLRCRTVFREIGNDGGAGVLGCGIIIFLEDALQIQLKLQAEDESQNINIAAEKAVNTLPLAPVMIPVPLRWELLKSLTPFSDLWNEFIAAAPANFICEIPIESVDYEDVELLHEMKRILPLYAPAGFMAFIDAWENNVITGWIKKEGDDKPRVISILLNMEQINGPVTANIFRQDLFDAGIGDGNFSFNINGADSKTPFACTAIKDWYSGQITAFRFFRASNRQNNLYTLSMSKTFPELEGAITARIIKPELLELALYIDDVFLKKISAFPSEENASSRTFRFRDDSLLYYLPQGSHALKLRFPDGIFSAPVKINGIHKIRIIDDLESLGREIKIIVPINGMNEEVVNFLETLYALTPSSAKYNIVNYGSPFSGELLQPGVELVEAPNCLADGLNSAAIGSEDVIIINPTVLVTPRWLESLLATASIPEAEIISACSICEPLPFGISEEEYAASLRRSSLFLAPEMNAPHSGCLYISRKCLADTGSFSAKCQQSLYIIEEEFCRRAKEKGMRLLMADNVPVFINDSTGELAESPDNKPDFKEGPNIDQALAFVRRRAISNIHKNSLVRILYITSTVTGGTPQTNHELMREMLDIAECYHMRCDSREMILSKVTPFGLEEIDRRVLEDPLEPFSHVSPEYDAIYANWLLEFDIDIVHGRSLIWHSLNLIDITKKLGRKFICSFHDYYAMSPNLNMVDDAGVFMGTDYIPVASPYRVDIWKTRLPVDSPIFSERWQRLMGEKIRNCDAFVTTSESVRSHLQNALPEIARDRFFIIPHGKSFSGFRSLGQPVMPGEKLRIVVLGNMNFQKGLGVINSLIEYDKVHQEILEFHSLGSCMKAAHPDIIRHGRYEQGELPVKLAEIMPHAAIVLSVCNETWCHTLTEYWAYGLPVFVFDFGTLGERMRNTGAGWILPYADTAECYARILDILHDESEQEKTVRAIKKWQKGIGGANTCGLMGSRYYRLYKKLQSGKKDSANITIGVCVKDETATSHIRLLERCRNDFKRKINWLPLKPSSILPSLITHTIDALYIQRNALPKAMIEQFIKEAHVRRIPYILDIDDDLFAMPQSHESSARFVSYLPFLEKLLLNASILTVSSRELANRFKRFGRPIKILENRLSKRLWLTDPPDRIKDNRIRALYFGTFSHSGDLRMILPALDEVAASYPDFSLLLIGISKADEDLKARSYIEFVQIPEEAKPYPAFCDFLREVSARADFGLAPLEDNFFNGGKSPLKIYEYGALGLVAIASDAGPYKDLKNIPGLSLCKNTAEAWINALMEAIRTGKDNRLKGKETRFHILQNHLLSDRHIHNWDDFIISHLGLRLDKSGGNAAVKIRQPLGEDA